MHLSNHACREDFSVIFPLGQHRPNFFNRPSYRVDLLFTHNIFYRNSCVAASAKGARQASRIDLSPCLIPRLTRLINYRALAVSRASGASPLIEGTISESPPHCCALSHTYSSIVRVSVCRLKLQRLKFEYSMYVRYTRWCVYWCTRTQGLKGDIMKSIYTSRGLNV